MGLSFPSYGIQGLQSSGAPNHRAFLGRCQGLTGEVCRGSELQCLKQVPPELEASDWVMSPWATLTSMLWESGCLKCGSLSLALEKIPPLPFTCKRTLSGIPLRLSFLFWKTGLSLTPILGDYSEDV